MRTFYSSETRQRETIKVTSVWKGFTVLQLQNCWIEQQNNSAVKKFDIGNRTAECWMVLFLREWPSDCHLLQRTRQLKRKKVAVSKTISTPNCHMTTHLFEFLDIANEEISVTRRDFSVGNVNHTSINIEIQFWSAFKSSF